MVHLLKLNSCCLNAVEMVDIGVAGQAFVVIDWNRLGIDGDPVEINGKQLRSIGNTFGIFTFPYLSFNSKKGTAPNR